MGHIEKGCAGIKIEYIRFFFSKKQKGEAINNSIPVCLLDVQRKCLHSFCGDFDFSLGWNNFIWLFMSPGLPGLTRCVKICKANVI